MRIPGNIIHFRIHTFLLQIEKIITHEYLLVILYYYCTIKLSSNALTPSPIQHCLFNKSHFCADFGSQERWKTCLKYTMYMNNIYIHTHVQHLKPICMYGHVSYTQSPIVCMQSKRRGAHDSCVDLPEIYKSSITYLHTQH